MPMKYRKGDRVSPAVKPIEGLVEALEIVDGEPQYLVSYEDAEGESHRRFFREEELNPSPDI